MAGSQGIRAGAAYVELTADRSRLQKDLAGAKQDLDQFGGKAGGGAGIDFKLGGWLRAGGAMLAVHASMDLIRGVVAGARQDFEGMLKAIESMPMGLGATAGAVASLYAEIAGFADERERLKRDVAEAKAFQKGLGRMAELEGEANTRRELAGLQGDALAAAREHLRLDVERKKIIEEAGKAGLWSGHAMVQAALGAVEAEGRALDLARARKAALAEQAEGQKGAQQDLEAGARAIDEQVEASERYERAMDGLRDRLAEVRGELDALGIQERGAIRDLAKDFAAGAMSAAAFEERVEEIRGTLAEIAAAEDWKEYEAEAADYLVSAVKEAAEMVPVAVQRVLVRGTMGGVGAALMTAGGVDPATKEMARDVKRLVELAQAGRLVFAQ